MNYWLLVQKNNCSETKRRLSHLEFHVYSLFFILVAVGLCIVFFDTVREGRTVVFWRAVPAIRQIRKTNESPKDCRFVRQFFYHRREDCMELPTIQELKNFIIYSKYRNFTAAAKAANITQSAFSAQMKKLEEIVGVCLIERSNRGSHLTPDGELFYEKVSWYHTGRCHDDGHARLRAGGQRRCGDRTRGYL